MEEEEKIGYFLVKDKEEMEEEEASGDGGSWEEQIYWTKFQYTQFFLFLRPGFHRHLALPEQFSKRLKAKLPEKVTLSGPSGFRWNVELTTIGDTMFFCHGWEAFSKDHDLKEKDLLVFKYNGDSGFELRIFDSQSLCEKPSAYFVRKCRNVGTDRDSEVKRKPVDSCPDSDGSLASVQDVNEGTSTGKLIEHDIIESPGGQPSVLQSNAKKARRDNETTEFCWSQGSLEPLIYDEINIKRGVGHSLSKLNGMPYVSTRLVTDEEKQKALQLALSKVSNSGFTIVMKPSHISNGYLAIPIGRINKYFAFLEKQDVILCINEKKWITKFSYRVTEKRGGLAGGWRNFVVDNRLHESDVCNFEPVATPINEPVMLEVSIFRVGEEDLTALASL